MIRARRNSLGSVVAKSLSFLPESRCTYIRPPPTRGCAGNPGTRNGNLAHSSKSGSEDQTKRLVVHSGFCTERGERALNEDFAAIADNQNFRFGVVAAIADGVGGSRGGRVAAELTV